MSELYNPRTGLYEVCDEITITAPDLTAGQIAAVSEMLDASRNEKGNEIARQAAGLPDDLANYETWMRERAEEAIKLNQTLGKKGLVLASPGLLVHLGEDVLSIHRRLEVMNSKNQLWDSAQNETNWAERLRSRQKLPTGVYLLMSQGVSMLGMSLSQMNQKNAASNKELRENNIDAEIQLLGIVPGYDEYHQSEEFRDSLNRKAIYTGDVTALGGVAGLDDWYGGGRVRRGGWDDVGGPGVGSVPAVLCHNENLE